MQAPPHACALPVMQAPPARHAAPTPQFLGKHLPGDATFQDRHDACQCAVRDAAWPSTFGLRWLRWQVRCDDLPQRIADQWRTHAANLPHGISSVRRSKPTLRFFTKCLKLLHGLYQPGEDGLHGLFFDTLDGIPPPIMRGFPDRGQVGWPTSVADGIGGIEHSFTILPWQHADRDIGDICPLKREIVAWGQQIAYLKGESPAEATLCNGWWSGPCSTWWRGATKMVSPTPQTSRLIIASTFSAPTWSRYARLPSCPRSSRSKKTASSVMRGGWASASRSQVSSTTTPAPLSLAPVLPGTLS
jgi:hypothetical protein